MRHDFLLEIQAFWHVRAALKPPLPEHRRRDWRQHSPAQRVKLVVIVKRLQDMVHRFSKTGWL